MTHAPGRSGKRMRVLVAMSGGVDSTIAAFALKAAGHEIAGVTMKLFCYEREDGSSRPCCDGEAIRAARRSAEILGIPHTVVDMEEVFRRDVIGDFISEYESGRTPNPCIRCNSHVKFGPLIEKARRMGFDAVATGHYVRLLPPRPPNQVGPYTVRATPQRIRATSSGASRRNGWDPACSPWDGHRKEPYAVSRAGCACPIGTGRKARTSASFHRGSMPVSWPIGFPSRIRCEGPDRCGWPPRANRSASIAGSSA